MRIRKIKFPIKLNFFLIQERTSSLVFQIGGAPYLPKLHCTRFLGQQASQRLIPPSFKREFRIVFRIDATPRDLVTPVDPPSIPSAESGLFSRYVGFNRISRVPALPILFPR